MTFSILCRTSNTLIFPRRCACWPIERVLHWKARQPTGRRLEGLRRPISLKSMPGRKRSSQKRLSESTEVMAYVDKAAA